MMNEELKPCPFCGGNAIVAEVDSEEIGCKLNMVCCEDCGISTPGSEDASAVIEIWNKRIS